MRWLVLVCLSGFLVSTAGGQTTILVERGTVAVDVLQLTIRSDQEVQYCKQVPYVEKKGDKINDPEKQRWVIRNLWCIGSLVGPEGKLLAEFSQIRGKAIEIEPALKASAWRIRSTDDLNYAKAGGGAADGSISQEQADGYGTDGNLEVRGAGGAHTLFKTASVSTNG